MLLSHTGEPSFTLGSIRQDGGMERSKLGPWQGYVRKRWKLEMTQQELETDPAFRRVAETQVKEALIHHSTGKSKMGGIPA